MNMLKVRGNKIVTSEEDPIQLRGTCVGGWMNMENFINGFPGAERALRATSAEILGEEKADFLFERMSMYFFQEEDVAFLRKCGVNTIRIPLNYRHFEDDEEPFAYKEVGFKRIDQLLEWCEKHHIYVILDMHAVQGWQNHHWHSDNVKGISLFWQHVHFQDRLVALWEAFAQRYKGNAVIAGFNLMNEPCTTSPDGDFPHTYFVSRTPHWDKMNRLYRRLVHAIRAIDTDRILFLEGDLFSRAFDGLEKPFADNLVYSSHNYTIAGFGPGVYPGHFKFPMAELAHWGGYWDRNKQVEMFKTHQGTVFTEEHHVPLWVGEFGSLYNWSAEEIPYRLAAMDDQISVFEQFGAHWTTWTYKDVGVMGWTMLDPESEYMKLIAPIQAKKQQLHVEHLTDRLDPSPVKKAVHDFAGVMESTIADPTMHPVTHRQCFQQLALSCYAATLLQPAYIRLFQSMSFEKIDDVMKSFHINHCKVNHGLIDVLQKYV